MQEDTYLNAHLVRYHDFVPCTTAFIDTRTPGSSEKENFTIIGPGVSENPDQYVHIARPHGFNVGGARQPPNCVNSQHSHETAEVFFVLGGKWRFVSGENGEDGEVFLSPGDTISIPTRCFRGFENVGETEGFLFAVLGGDDPGRVTWAPYVFQKASEFGLELLENGNLVDTAAGEELPRDVPVMPTTSAADVQSMRRFDSKALEGCVIKHDQRAYIESLLGHGILEAPLLGLGAVEGLQDQAKPSLSWAHGFQMRHLQLAPAAQSRPYASDYPEVLVVQRGRVSVVIRDREISLNVGDVLSLEVGATRVVANNSAQPAEIFSIRGGDSTTLDLQAEGSS